MAKNHEDVLASLAALQQAHELSIIKLSEPIALPPKDPSASFDTNRSSDVSADAFDNPTPASLEVDLTHYKELFSKLRFSYLEQVTKEKFLRAIVGDPPLVVEHQENVELEAQLAEVKVSLKAQKVEAAQMVEELERRGRELTQRHEAILEHMGLLQTLPSAIDDLQGSIAELESTLTPASDSASNLPLPATLALLSEREDTLTHLNHQLSSLETTLPRKTRELERLEAELRPLEVQRLGSTAAAKEARRRKDDAMGGVGDDLEERGRWWRGVEAGVRGLLDVEA
ncbi:MAG: hypothetical protein M1833_000729 [Piccolia ochrophora]|nr:MAG: hypothetical protein M1833_000729 [Piccolia ochrophora]